MLHRMKMYSTICKVANNSEKGIVGMIIGGFTGILKRWWDNTLTDNQKQEIFSGTKTKQEGLTSQPISVEDCVYTLICTILEHFTSQIANQN